MTARLLVTIILIALQFTGCHKNKRLESAKPKNLLLITLDTTRADHLGCYGYASANTPNLDALAERGTLFETAVAHVPLTRPGHATILTGLLPHHHGIWSNGPYRLEPKFSTLGEKFQQQGVKTAGVVSSFVLNRSFGFSRGFHLFDDRMEEMEGADPEKSAAEATTTLLKWFAIEIQPPFFVWIHFYDPHYPYEPHEPFKKEFADAPYDGEIAAMDAQIGVIISELSKRSWLNDTLVIAVGDHGEGLGEHSEDTHGYFIYDSTMKVPLILAGPGVPNDKRAKEQVSLVDLEPTILDAFELSSTTKSDGKSFWKNMQSGKMNASTTLLENRTIQFQFGWAPISAIRTKEWKWINAPEPELYDLRNDPHEKQNIAVFNSKQSAVMKQMWQKNLPQEEEQIAAALSPEEQEKLESLGYLSGSPSRKNETAGPDPKKFSGILSDIDLLIRLRQQKQMTELQPVVDRILTRDPSNRFASRVKGEVLIAQHQYAEALPLLKQLALVEENHPETYANLAIASEQNGELDAALHWYAKATAPPWIHWPALESFARFAIQNPDLINPQTLIQRFAQLDAQSYRERLSLARAFALIAAWTQAAHWYQQALQAKPSGDEALVGLAQTYQKTGRLVEALDTLSKVSPETTESLFVSGTILVDLGKRNEACQKFEASMSLNPRNVNLLFGLGYHLSVCGKTADAIKAYNQTLTRQPNHSDALYNLAQLEERNGNSKIASDLYRRFVKIAPQRLRKQIQIAKQKLQ